jgi:uncharacterized membrane protein
MVLFLKRMAKRVEHSVAIYRAVEGVFAFVSDFGNLPQWQSKVVEVNRAPEGPARGMGAAYRVVVRHRSPFLLFVRRFETTYEVTEYELNRKIGFEGGLPAAIRLKGQLVFEPMEGGTRIVAVLELNGTEGFFFDKLVLPVYARTVERELKTDLTRLKYLLEVVQP